MKEQAGPEASGRSRPRPESSVPSLCIISSSEARITYLSAAIRSGLTLGFVFGDATADRSHDKITAWR